MLFRAEQRSPYSRSYGALPPDLMLLVAGLMWKSLLPAEVRRLHRGRGPAEDVVPAMPPEQECRGIDIGHAVPPKFKQIKPQRRNRGVANGGVTWGGEVPTSLGPCQSLLPPCGFGKARAVPSLLITRLRAQHAAEARPGRQNGEKTFSKLSSAYDACLL